MSRLPKLWKLFQVPKFITQNTIIYWWSHTLQSTCKFRRSLTQFNDDYRMYFKCLLPPLSDYLLLILVALLVSKAVKYPNLNEKRCSCDLEFAHERTNTNQPSCIVTVFYYWHSSVTAAWQCTLLSHRFKYLHLPTTRKAINTYTASFRC